MCFAVYANSQEGAEGRWEELNGADWIGDRGLKVRYFEFLYVNFLLDVIMSS